MERVKAMYYIVRVKKGVFGEAMLGNKAYMLRKIRPEQLTSDMQIMKIVADTAKPKPEAYDKYNPKPIKDRMTGRYKGYKEVKIAPHVLAPAPGYKKPFDYKLYNTLRRLKRL
jgi:hypothetical protein